MADLCAGPENSGAVDSGAETALNNGSESDAPDTVLSDTQNITTENNEINSHNSEGVVAQIAQPTDVTPEKSGQGVMPPESLAIDQGLAEFATNKGFTSDYLKTSDGQKALKMAMEAEKSLLAIRAERDTFKSEIDKFQQYNDAALLTEESSEKNVSPIESAKTQLQDALEGLAILKRCDVSELRHVAPGEYAEIMTEYQTEVLPAAYEKLHEWQQKSELSLKEKEAAKNRLESEVKRIKESASNNIHSALRENPKLMEVMKDAGVDAFAEKLMTSTALSAEQIAADPDMFSFMKSAAEAIVLKKQLPQMIEEAKRSAIEEYEKNLKKVKTAELPGSSFSVESGPGSNFASFGKTNTERGL